MDYEELYDLMKQISEVDNRTSKKLFNLIYSHLSEKNEVNKKNIESKIRNLLFTEFMSLIDKKSRDELYNININIAEDSHNIESKFQKWYITNYGAEKYALKDDSLILDEIIPREHNIGFILDNDNASEETKKFYMKNQSELDRISGYMDRKEDIINYEYQPARNVSLKLTESLIDYLGFRRIDDKKEIDNIQKR